MVKFAALVDWKQRRTDKKTEAYWEINTPVNSLEEYQKKWNFREIEYNHEPSTNGLDCCNPAFAYDKKLTKYIKIIEVRLD